MNPDDQPARAHVDIERPVGVRGTEMAWQSDVLAMMLRRLGIEWIAMVPGSSYRGLQDSLVNLMGNRHPQIVVCLHEEHAVAIAEGWARVTRRPMAVGLHANVGLLHGSMCIYNAWCDRIPMLILGATGPVDADARRPWIDWVHTAKDQGALVRSFVKWDDQPASVPAAVESLLRAWRITQALPQAPVYLCFDVSLQEAPLAAPTALPDPARFRPPAPPAPPVAALDEAVARIRAARNPLFLFGRVSRDAADWDRRIRLAEAAGAAIMTQMHTASSFPTDHPAHLLPPCGEAPSGAEARMVAQADLIVSFDWIDLAGFLRGRTGSAQTSEPVAAGVISISLDELLANGFAMDHQALPAADLPLLACPDATSAALLERLETHAPATGWDFSAPHWTTHLPSGSAGDAPGRISLGDFALEVRALADRRAVTYIRLPLGWPRAASRSDHPLSYLGKDLGGAVGIGPGHAVGAALALKGTGRMPVAVLGDGDTVMGITALWTASHMDLPLLIVVADNLSYFNDERHQERIAERRGRPVENRWIGQRLTDPPIDICAMARAQGFESASPVTTRAALARALEQAAETVAEGGRVLIDARIEEGYADGFGRPAEE